MILTSKGAPAFTQFGSSSGGWTSAGQFAYLPAKADPYDGWSGNPVHELVAEGRRRPDREGLAGDRQPQVGSTVVTRDGNGRWKGRVGSMRLVGTKAGKATSISVSGDGFRSALGLRSTWFTFA